MLIIRSRPLTGPYSPDQSDILPDPSPAIKIWYALLVLALHHSVFSERRQWCSVPNWALAAKGHRTEVTRVIQPESPLQDAHCSHVLGRVRVRVKCQAYWILGVRLGQGSGSSRLISFWQGSLVKAMRARVVELRGIGLG